MINILVMLCMLQEHSSIVYEPEILKLLRPYLINSVRLNGDGPTMGNLGQGGLR